MSRPSEPDTGSSLEHDGAALLTALDAASRWRLKVFALKLAIVGLFAVAFAMQQHYPLLRTLAVFASCQSVFAGVTAAFQHQRVDAVTLTAWDEMAAFFAVTELTRLIAVVVS